MLHFFSRRLRRDERGFTLIELLIVVAIIAILAAILIPNFLRARAQSQVSASKGNLKNIGTALESYFVDKGYYPTALGDLTGTPAYIRAVPIDPCTTVAYNYAASGTPASNYRVQTPPWTTSGCNQVLTGANAGLYYEPTGGLGITP